MTRQNPFRVGEHVRGIFFTDRAEEVRVVRRAMRDRGRLLVWGPRRMGKSTVLGVTSDRVRRDGGMVLQADLSTIATIAEAAERLLAAVSREEQVHEKLYAWVTSLAPVVTLGADATGRPRLGLSVESRPRAIVGERALLERVLDRIDALAEERRDPTVVVLDEVQRLSEVGGEVTEWLLRGRMQEHRHTAYVCAGSKESLARDMLQPQRAFYKFFEMLHVGPIDPDHLGRWIDERLIGSGIEAQGVGDRIVAAAGPRTQDILLVARTLWYRAAGAAKVRPDDTDAAVDEIVTLEDAVLGRTWEELSPVQQRVLRALASGARQLHAAETRDRFALGPSSSVTTALTTLLERSILGRLNGDITFDSPFFRAWIAREVLA